MEPFLTPSEVPDFERWLNSSEERRTEMDTILSLAPSIVVMMTSFTRIVVVLSLLRTALGTATAPPNTVIVALALFLTAFVMGPSFERAYDVGIKPLIANQITTEQAFERSAGPLRHFMLKNVREKGLNLIDASELHHLQPSGAGAAAATAE